MFQTFLRLSSVALSILQFARLSLHYSYSIHTVASFTPSRVLIATSTGRKSAHLLKMVNNDNTPTSESAKTPDVKQSDLLFIWECVKAIDTDGKVS